MKYWAYVLGSLCATFSLLVNAQPFTLAGLMSLPPFNLEHSPPTRAQLNAQFGVGREFSRGEGGEKQFIQCYSINQKSDSPSIFTLAFLFRNTRRSTHASGVLVSTDSLGCTPIRSKKAHHQLASSDLLNLFKLSPKQIRDAAPSGGNLIPSEDPEKTFIMVYESQKIISTGMAQHSPETAYALHRNRSASYRLDISTSITSEFQDQKMKAATVWMQTSY